MVTDPVRINLIKAATDIAQAFAPTALANAASSSGNADQPAPDDLQKTLYVSAAKFLTAQFDNFESESNR
jgi:hypothetical protein